MPDHEKEKIIRFRIHIIQNQLTVPHIMLWEDDERNEFLSSSFEMRQSILEEKNEKAASLRRRLGPIEGLGDWLRRRNREHPDVRLLFDRFHVCYHEIYPDESTYRFVKNLNRLRSSLAIGAGLRRSARIREV